MDKNISSKQVLNDMISRHYKEALEAKKSGELVAWATSIVPQELLETMDIKVVYPENHAAVLGARKDAPAFLQNAENNGYSNDLCSYARVNIGYANLKESAAGNIPMPDFIFCCNNICNTVIKWYENLAREMRIPMILIDTPFNHTFDVPEHSVKYIREQFHHAIGQLEQITGKKFDHDRFQEVMNISTQTARWWKKATALAAAQPSPFNGFDLFNYMAVIVCMRGKQEGLDLFKLWAEELQGKIDRGEGPWKDQPEKYRVMWDGIACWPHLADTSKILRKNGINLITSTYPDSWTIVYDSDDLDAMARAYSSNYANRNLAYGAGNIVQIVKDFSLDGIIYHSNRSCKLMDFRQYEVQRQVQEQTGVASVIFDGDQTDPRAFSLAQYETRIQALMEMMEQRKNERPGGQ
ncbi:MAG: Benzoyl-CoA reductase/2-hydroxyglutaryl-CoA dehydratase subunit BcrC/BadD/HgdB [Syntrophaceae bacterium]|nr:MAG: Benzoyl-CoA reductase/2-hydroxyglutaryl-CoA dehydratase subunit BcrC/BadD/HgdB [Syntrophaceae bacterium]